MDPDIPAVVQASSTLYGIVLDILDIVHDVVVAEAPWVTQARREKRIRELHFP